MLIFFLLFTAFIPRIKHLFIPVVDNEVFRLVDSYDEHVRSAEDRKREIKKYVSAKKSKYRKPPAIFDPNLYSKEEWMHLGLSEKQAEVVFNFAERRGIYSEEDITKIYVISDEFKNVIVDSIRFGVKPNKYQQKNESKYTADNTNKKTKVVELNTAEEEGLLEVKGIGPYYAKNILIYRQKLGGFYSVSQLLELYKMDSVKYLSIMNSFTVDPSKIKKIDINTCTIEELAKHPYISKNVANSIVKMRVKWEKYSNFDQLLKSDLIDKELLQKIQPYLTLSP